MNENVSQNGAQDNGSRQNGPLEGIKVIEFGNFVAGPFAGQILADMGAEVIKVEPPTGDPWRVSQPFAPYESRTFLPLNRGVKSVTLNLKDPHGKAALEKIVKMSDGVISNNRPDTDKALGIDYESLSRHQSCHRIRRYHRIRNEGTARRSTWLRPRNARLHRRRHLRGQDHVQRTARGRMVIVLYRPFLRILRSVGHSGWHRGARRQRQRAKGRDEPDDERDRHAVHAYHAHARYAHTFHDLVSGQVSAAASRRQVV